VSEAQLVLIFVLTTIVVVLLAWLTLFSVVSAKSRVIREQRRSLEAEQRLRKAQEAFMDNAHHELRTPLQVMSGHLQMLEFLDPTPRQTAILDQARDAAAHLGRQIQSLLDLSSLAQGTLVTHPDLEDLGAQLQSIADGFKAHALAKGLTAMVALDQLPRPVHCDAPRICQALEALLDNALGFTERGNVAFRLRATPMEGAWQLRFEIEDEGPGLPPDWERLMHPFEQEERSLRRRRGGLGIGLPLAAGIVELMGGRLGLIPQATGTLAWVEITLSEKRRGAPFLASPSSLLKSISNSS